MPFFIFRAASRQKEEVENQSRRVFLKQTGPLQDDKTLTPDDKAKYTITFGNDGRVSARIDCNRGTGTWKSSGPNQLQFGPPGDYPGDVPTGIPLRSQSHRQGLGVCAIVHHQGGSSLSVADKRTEESRSSSQPAHRIRRLFKRLATAGPTLAEVRLAPLLFFIYGNALRCYFRNDRI